MNTTGIQGSPAARRLRSWLGTGVAAGLSVAIVVAVLAAAITLPSNALLGNRPDANALAYANSGPGTFNPLDDGFVRGRLGDLLPTTAADARRPPLASTRLLPRTAPAGKRAGLPPVVKQAPLSNDDFVSAYPIEAVPFRGETKTSGASRQPGEPASCLPAGGTVWYRYTAPSTLTVFANTFGSGYALTLGAFEGDNIANLRQVACTTSTSGNASATFQVSAGRTYYFQLTGPVAGGQLLFTLVDNGVNYQAAATKGAGVNNSYWSALSADGRYLTFITGEPEYAPRPSLCKRPRHCSSLIWRDLQMGSMRRIVSVVSSEDPEDPLWFNNINSPTISDDGSIVAFDGSGEGLTPDKHNPATDVFTADTRTGAVRRISSSWRGGNAHGSPTSLDPVYDAIYGPCPESNCGFAAWPSLSADGRSVVFTSNYADLYQGQAPSEYYQVFLKDLRTGSVRMLSVTPLGAPANGTSFVAQSPAVSADGRYVTFNSYAADLPGLLPSLGCTQPYSITNACKAQVYLADTERGSVTHVSRSTIGVSNGNNHGAAISADGNHVVFTSADDHLVSGDTNLAADVFKWDRSTGATTIISMDSQGRQGAGDTTTASEYARYLCLVLCDARVIAATNPVFAATRPVVPWSIAFGEIYQLWNGGAPQPTTSSDGRYVAFNTSAALTPEDTNGLIDVYVRDTVTGATVLVSKGPGGAQSNGNSFMPFLSADASTIGFTSAASNLVARDSNGTRWSVFVAPLHWTE